MIGVTTPTRPRNRRGEGSLLREDILAAAGTLLEQTGSEESVTLRAVARTVGISAPSIYAHFADRQAIVDAVVDDAYDEFRAVLARATGGSDDPVEQLWRGCRAYLDFARTHPHRYRLLFERRDQLDRAEGGKRTHGLPRRAAFQGLADAVGACVEAGRSSSTDPSRDAVAIWSALHGYATLRANVAQFSWPAREDTLDRILRGLARIDERPPDDVAPD